MRARKKQIVPSCAIFTDVISMVLLSRITLDQSACEIRLVTVKKEPTGDVS